MKQMTLAALDTELCPASLYDEEIHSGTLSCRACSFTHGGYIGGVGMVPPHLPTVVRRSYHLQRMGAARWAALHSLAAAHHARQAGASEAFTWGCHATEVCLALGIALTQKDCFHPSMGPCANCPACGYGEESDSDDTI